MKAKRNHQAFMVLLLTHRHPGSSSDATKGKKMLIAFNRQGKKQEEQHPKCFRQIKPNQVWKELDRRWPAVVQLKLSKGDAITGPEKNLLVLLL